jgi:MFS family permease
VAQAILALMAAGVLAFVRIPKLSVHDQLARPGRPLAQIALQPLFIVAVACGVASYFVMNLLMTSAPLAMVGCDHTVTDASLGIQWHVLAMYAPSFFTGGLIMRFGVQKVVLAGLALLALSALVGYSGITIAHFWIALILLGIGWNLSFIGATTMVTACHRPEERNKVQAFNDFLIFGIMAVGSFSSGQLLANYGWATVNELAFPVVLVAGGLLLWVQKRQRLSAV